MTTDPAPTFAHCLPTVVALAREAGAAVMAIYATAFDVRGKADASPVTEADERAEALIVPRLRALLPGVPVVAEEAVAAHGAPAVAGRFWLVDPLDGTREFIQRNGEFTVNIALIDQGRPVLGVVLAPACGPHGRLFAGVVGQGAWLDDGAGRDGAGPDGTARRPIHCRSVPPEGLTVVASRSHGDAAKLAAFLQGRPVARQRQAGSSLKLCLLAAGEADLYPRFGRTMEWDIAAGDAVLRAAGGEVQRMDDGTALAYGKPGFENPDFVAQAGAGRPR